MDRLTDLAQQLSATLEELHDEAASRDLRTLMPPLSWLDEANGWLKYELEHLHTPDRDPVPFSYIPIHLRR
jgi:hypothetical protein